MKKGGRDAMLLCGWSSSPLSVRERRGEKFSSRRKGNASDCFKKQTFDNNGPLATT